MTWTTFTLRVDTPLFSGDDPEITVTPGKDGPPLIRVPSIRGVLRFWYRAVAAGHGVTDLSALAEAESSVFGSTKTPSPIAMRVTKQPNSSMPSQWPNWAVFGEKPGQTGGGDKGQFFGARYLLGQGLADRKGIVRPFHEVNKEFTLQVRFTGQPECDNAFMLAFWAWLTYGGLGARTRRGFGRLSCVQIDNPPAGWSIDLLRPDVDLDGHLDRWDAVYPDDVCAAARGAFPSGPVRGGRAERLARFSTLAEPHWFSQEMRVNGERCASLDRLLHSAGSQWRRFRTNGDIPGPSPEWAKTVLGSSSEYPIAAAGLPTNYFRPRSKSSPSIKAAVEIKSGGVAVRRASPIWLTPIRIGDTDSYALMTHVFFAELAPDARLAVTRGSRAPRDLPIPDPSTLRATWEAWLDGESRPTP